MAPDPTLPLRLYAALTTGLAPLLRLHLRGRARRGKEIAARLPEREGIDPTPRPPGRLLWLHAASVGETVSLLPVLAALPGGLSVLVTTGTVTSAELLAARLPALATRARVLHRFVPLDVPAWVARFVDHWRPDAVALVESELWPNLIGAAARRRVPLLLLNARLSAASAARWARLPHTAAWLLGRFTLIQAQSEPDAERLRGLGAAAVESPGNLKFAAAPLPADDAELARLRAAIGTRPVWLAASTHPGEEAIVADAHRRLAATHPGLLTIIAPRHPARGPEIAAALSDLAPTRRAAGHPPGGAVWIADTLGELGLLYRLAPIVFVGGSLVPRGGQNPLEPARLGCVLAAGPGMENQAEAVATLTAAGALTTIPDAPSLAAWVAAMLADPARRAQLAVAARAAAGGHDALPDLVAGRLARAVGL